MMGLTRKGEYAVRGIIYLARQKKDQKALIAEMAVAIDAPQNFLAKIMQRFSQSGIVQSSRGVGGGFSLAKPSEEITLLDIVESVEGSILVNHCLLRSKTCKNDETCRAHRAWQKVQDQLRATLAGFTVASLAK